MVVRGRYGGVSDDWIALCEIPREPIKNYVIKNNNKNVVTVEL